MLYSKMMFKLTFGLFILVSLRVRDVKLDGTGLEQCYSVDSSQGISSDVLLKAECKNSPNTLKVSWSYAPGVISDIWNQLIGYQCYTGSKNLSILEDYSVITTDYIYYEIPMINEINCVVKGCIEKYVGGGKYRWFELNTASCQFDTPPTMPDITDDIMNTSTMISTTVYLSSIIASPFISSSSDSISYLISPSVTASETHHLSTNTPLSYIKKDSSKATTSSSTAKMSTTISTTTSPPINIQVQASTTTEGITSSEATPPTTEQPSSPQLNVIVVIVIIVMVSMTAVCVIIFSITGFHRKLNHISSKNTIQEVDAVSTEFEVIAYSIYSTVPESPSLLTLIEEPRVPTPGPGTHQYDSSNDQSHQYDSNDPSHLYEPIDTSFLTAPTPSTSNNVIILNNSGTLRSNTSTTSNCITPEHTTVVSEMDQQYSPGIKSEDDASFIITDNTEIPPTPNNGMILRESCTGAVYLDSPDSSYTPFPSSSSCGYISDSYERSSISTIARLDSTTSDYHSSTSSHRRSSSMTSNYIHCNT